MGKEGAGVGMGGAAGPRGEGMEEGPWLHQWSGGALPDSRTLEGMSEMMVELFGEERRHFAEQERAGRYRVVRKAWSWESVLAHLRGKMTIAVYPIRQQPGGPGMARWLCHDLDGGADSLPEFEELLGVYGRLGLSAGVQGEFSGRRGFHVWVFTQRMPAGLLRRLGRHAAELAGVEAAELFPKQSRLEGESIGNPVKLPLGVHRVSGNRCLFACGAEEPVPLRESAVVLRERLAGRLTADQIVGVVPRLKRPDCSVDQSGASYAKRLRHFAESQRACVRLVERGVEYGRRHDAALLLLASYRAQGLSETEAVSRLAEVDERNRPPLAEEDGPRWAETKARYVYHRQRFEISCYWPVIHEAGWCTVSCPLHDVMYDDGEGDPPPSG